MRSKPGTFIRGILIREWRSTRRNRFGRRACAGPARTAGNREGMRRGRHFGTRTRNIDESPRFALSRNRSSCGGSVYFTFRRQRGVLRANADFEVPHSCRAARRRTAERAAILRTQMIEERFHGLTLQIDYDLVSKRVEFRSTAPDDLTVLGMLELAKASLLMRQMQQNNGGLSIVVPRPKGMT